MEDPAVWNGANGHVGGKPNGVAKSPFAIDRVRLMFNLGNVVSLAVANNTLAMAFTPNKIVRIDLERPDVVDECEIPRKPGAPSDPGDVAGVFLDPAGSNLIATTQKGENYILSQQTTKPRHLTPLKGIRITAVGWNPSTPSRGTGDILVGSADGAVYVTAIDAVSNDYFKKEVRRLKQVWKIPAGEPIGGVYCHWDEAASMHRVVVSSGGSFWYWEQSGNSLDYVQMFERYEAFGEAFDAPQGRDGIFAVAPPPSGDVWAGLTGIGIIHGTLTHGAPDIFEKANLLLFDQLEPATAKKAARADRIALTQYHVLLLASESGDLLAINRLNNRVVFEGVVETDHGERLLGMSVDHRASTFWVFSDQNIHEVKAGDEQREVWRAYLENGEHEKALALAPDSYARDAVSLAYGDKLLNDGAYERAAELLGKSSRPFEGVALEFVERKQTDALQLFISTRLRYRRAAEPVQRTILACWMVELLMEKLDGLDDLLAADSSDSELASKREAVHDEFRAFVSEYKDVLDRGVVYEVISTHGRRDELLFFARTVGDHRFVLNYWIRAEQWEEALALLRSVNDPALTYQYATVLLVNAPRSTVETWMRIEGLDVSKLVPAMLKYVSHYRGKTDDNQVVRYLLFAIRTLKLESVALYNTLISVYASASDDETALLSFLNEAHPGSYDSDFALRVCTAYGRIRSCVRIYASMGQYEEAVKLALQHRNFELAMEMADLPADNKTTRKSLWLEIARLYVSDGGLAVGSDASTATTSTSLKVNAALSLLKRCDLLRIDDLLPLFPDFTVIDDFRDEIIASLEQYNDDISRVNRSMEESQKTLDNIKDQLKNFRKRYVLVEPGEACALCRFPLATRKFYVFPCQHGFHFDCLIDGINKFGDHHTKERLAKIQLTAVKKDIPPIMDEILSEKCVLCAEARVELIDTPLGNVSKNAEWDL